MACPSSQSWKYDVALSYAGEQHPYVQRVAGLWLARLKECGGAACCASTTVRIA